MSSIDKQGDVAVQRKDDGITEKDKAQNDAKSDTSPQKRSASELNSTDETKQKIQKTDHKILSLSARNVHTEDEKENGESEEKYDEDGEDDDDVVPDDYDEGEDGEDDDGAEDDEDEEEEA